MTSGGDRRTRKGPDRRADEYWKLNLDTWERTAAEYERRNARSLKRDRGKAWGIWRVPERELRLLGPVRGKDVLELGCGAAWWSIALAREGARVVGLDFSGKRLAQARRLIERSRAGLPLVRASAAEVPFASDAFDVVLSDYGATTFTDPYRLFPEASRVLRTGGILVFAHASPFRTVAQNLRADRMERRLGADYFRLRTVRTEDSVEFQLPYSEWVRLFASCGLAVERLVEPPAPSTGGSTYVSRRDQAWARRWPMESIWRLRKIAPGPHASARTGVRARF